MPDTGDVYLVPAFAGLGAPQWDAAARGTIVGLTRGTTRAHVARAALESIAFQTADLIEAMQQDAGRPLSELRVDGGAARNDLLLQFQADLLGVPVLRPDEHRDHRFRRRGARRARRRVLAIAGRTGGAVDAREALRTANGSRRSGAAPRALEPGSGAIPRLGAADVKSQSRPCQPRAIVVTLAIAGGVHWWLQHDRHTYLTGDTADFVAMFAPPPALIRRDPRASSTNCSRLQASRTPAEVAARTRRPQDRDPAFLRRSRLSRRSAIPTCRCCARWRSAWRTTVRPYVRAAKEKFRRLRPYEIEPRMEPCIDNVRGDLSYPSGHANYGYVMAYLLRDMVPERDAADRACG